MAAGEEEGGTACGESPVCVGWLGSASGMAVLAGMCSHLSLWEDICASPPAPRGLRVNLEMGRMMSVVRTSAPRLTTPNA